MRRLAVMVVACWCLSAVQARAQTKSSSLATLFEDIYGPNGLVLSSDDVQLDGTNHADRLTGSRHRRQRLDAPGSQDPAAERDSDGQVRHLLRRRCSGVHGRKAAPRLLVRSRRHHSKTPDPCRRDARGRQPAEGQRLHARSRIHRERPDRCGAGSGHRHARRPVRPRPEAAGLRNHRGRRQADDRQHGQ